MHVPVVELAGEGVRMILGELKVEHRADGLEAVFTNKLVTVAPADVEPRDPFASVLGEQDHLGAIRVETEARPRVGHMDAHVGALRRGDDEARRAGVV